MRFILLIFLVGFLASCAHNSVKDGNTAAPSDANTNPATNNGEVKAQYPDLPSFRISDSKNEIVDKELEFIPTEVNKEVEKWLKYFQGKGSVHMERYLARSTRYEKLMKKVLHENGLPEDLFYVALIESGFNSKATSHAAAVGYWQFIRGTGRRYGLEINKFVDERRDPVLATQAAAEYFKGLYSVFGSWYLAMASYNVGEGRIKKAVMRNMTRDFWELARKRSFPRETVNYIPKFIAAKMIAKDPVKYGFDGIDYLPEIEYDQILVDHPVNLREMAEKLNYNYEDFKALNPKFKGEIAIARDGKTLSIRVPPGMKETGLVAANDSKVDQVEFVADAGETQVYKIKRGDSLYTIARKYRTTVAYLRDLNDITKGKLLRIGSRIFVPDRTPLKSKRIYSRRPSQKSSREVASKNKYSGRYHIVQNGDSLIRIAKKYDVSVSDLKKMNHLRSGKLIKLGARIKLPSNTAED